MAARRRAPSDDSATCHRPTRLQSRCLAYVCALVLWLLAAGSALAQTVREDFYISDGTVNAEVLSGNTLFIAGSFARIGPVTGSGIPLDVSTGLATSGFPHVVGAVLVVVPDGAGGWYVGGLFTAVGGQPRANLAHVLADNTVSPWDPGTNGLVRTLALSGSVIYAGGDFTSAAGQPRNRIAALDASSGVASAWNPDADGSVRALAEDGGVVYAGGSFTNVGGQARSRIAALDGGTALATAWDPNANNLVFTIVVSGGTVYAGGGFTNVGGQARNRIAALDQTLGLASAWNPNANGQVSVIAVNGGTVYAGGMFTTIGGQGRNRIAALNGTTGLATAWNPSASAQVSALAASGATVYAGGDFISIGGAPRSRIAALDATTGLATPWDPSAYGPVLALATAGGAVYAGGTFSGLGGARRNNLAALDVTSGAATSWDPDANSEVLALALSGGAVYAGGSFTSVGGQPRNRIAAIDVATGLATGWNPNANGEVSALAVHGVTLYTGGSFTSVGGQTRNNIAALDLASGAATAWNPNANGQIFALEPGQGTLYAGGLFSSIGGQVRNSIAAIDSTTGLATAWNANANGTIRALQLSCNTLYAAGFFTTIGGQSRSRIAALDVSSGLATSWNPTASGPVFAMALRNGRVYLGGIFFSVGGQSRQRLAALDPVTGFATAWDPGVLGTVRALAVGGGAVYAGGGFTSVGGLNLSNLTAMTADPSFSCPALAVVPSSIPTGVVNVAYSQMLSGTGGTAPFCYAVTAGSLPAGLTLVAGTGEITGTPTAAGTMVFTVGVTDANGCTGSAGYVLSIFATPPGSTVAANTGGLCISPAHPCVSVPVEYTRSETAPARAISVTVQLDVTKLGLCTPGTPAASIQAGSWLAGFGSTLLQVVDNGGGSYTVDQTILGSPCGVTVGGELFTMQLESVGGDGTGAITVTTVLARDCDGAVIPVAPGLSAGITIGSVPPAAVADLASAQVLSGNGPGPTTGITLTWASGGLGAVSLYRAPFGAYPEYDDGGPVSPPDPGLAPGAPWTLVTATATSGLVDQPPVRGSWHYVAIVTDACGNVSTASNMTTGSLNYHLGDVSDGVTAGQGDNRVGGVDVSLLGANYGISEPEITTRGVAYLDVGPTVDLQPTSRPSTDDNLDFEDLILFALNFDLVSAPLLAARPAKAVGTEAGPGVEEFRVVAPSMVEAGQTVTAALWLKGAGRVQGFSAVLGWDAAVVEPVGMESGQWVEGQGGVVMTPAPGVVDAVLLGARGQGMTGEGMVAQVRFRALRTGNAAILLANLKARDGKNRPLGESEQVSRAEALRPGRTVLLAPRPNPVRAGGATELEFSLAEAGRVELAIYGVDGRQVRMLVREQREAGVYRVAWDGRDQRGHASASGIYYARLMAGGLRLTQKVLRVR